MGLNPDQAVLIEYVQLVGLGINIVLTSFRHIQFYFRQQDSQCQSAGRARNTRRSFYEMDRAIGPVHTPENELFMPTITIEIELHYL